MNLTVPIYQRVEMGTVTWTTLTLGPHTRSQSGRAAIKVQHALIGELKALVQKLEPAQLEPLQLKTGVRLERLRLDLTLQGKEGRRKTTGRFPLIVEPRWANREQRLLLVYHPDRQGEWFPLEDESELDARAVLYFQRAWGDLSDQEISALQTDGKDRIKIVSFSARPRSLLDGLPDRKRGVWDDLVPQAQRQEKRPDVLRQIGVDLTQRAADASLPLGMPRSPYREQLQLLLGGRLRRPVLVVGPPQSGKTTLLNRWVHDQLLADGYESHRNLDRAHHVWSIAGQRIIAGMSYLGDWEQRCVDLLQGVAGKKVILRVEDVSALGRLGRTRDSERNLAEFFRGPLQRREVLIVGECSAEQMQRLEEEAPGFASLFARVHVVETTSAETSRMMLNEVRALELAQNIAIDPIVLRQILELAGTLFSGVAFPGKALDLLRELARQARRASESEERRALRPADLLHLLSQRTGLPEELLRLDQPLDAASVRRAFERRIMGQEEGIVAATDLVLRIRAGLTDPRRPYAVYLFTGPTGTGKTELAKCIAEYLYGSTSRLARFDMGELSGPDAAARLVGDAISPRGALTEQAQQQPFCVLLLDEIEKAHPSVLNLLLQLFDEGRLTDAVGATADFTHSVVIMTSNLGARVQPPIGYAEAPDAVMLETARAVREFFPPELFNRIDRVVGFRPLTPESARQIAAKELRALLARRGLTERNIFVYPTDAALRQVVADGFDPLLGARPVKRYLEQQIASRLAEEICAAPASLMRIIHIYSSSAADRALRLHVESLAEVQPTLPEQLHDELFEVPVRDLQERLPRALDLLDELLASEAVTSIADEIGDRLRDSDLGAVGETLYNLDSMRQSLHRLRGRIGQLHARRHGDRQQLLQALAEVPFAERTLRRVRDPGEHAVLIELLPIGLGPRPAGLRTPETPLCQVLARAYLGARGELERWALRDADGGIVDGEATGPDDARLRARPQQVVLLCTGLGVLDFFGGEIGCHVWRSLRQGTDVVRVRVWPAGDATPRQVVEEHGRSARAFAAALERGDAELPPNPDRLLPLVREYRFDLPVESTGSVALEIEDYALGYTGTLHARALADALARLWLLRMGRTARPDPPAPGRARR